MAFFTSTALASQRMSNEGICLLPVDAFRLLPAALRGNAQPQGVQLDEAARVGLVVGAAVVFHGGDGLVEERVLRLASRGEHGALVELHAYPSVHVLLGGVDQTLQKLSLRAE